MAFNDELGNRMKQNYETISKTRLIRRTPVAIRIDGKAFHTFTRGFKKPFDNILISSMQETMKYLCENIQGCVLGYTQSDEITLILQDYKTFETQAWFDYEVQKMCSVSASMATMKFNKILGREVGNFINKCFGKVNFPESFGKFTLEEENLLSAYHKATEKGAMFDSRCFNIPKEEVTNLLFWRQLDASRNSVQMVGRAYYSHKELYSKNNSQIQDMLMEKGVNWNNFPTHQKRGSCCIKDNEGHWFVDNEIPIFKGDGREYVEKLINCEEN